MSGRALIRLADDPRAVTLAVVALVATGLWIALWQAMTGMAETAMPDAPMAAMPGMPGVSVAAAPDWSAGLVLSTVAMWLLMMAAMMLPAMAPMLAVYSGLAAKEAGGATLALRIGLFALGYFLLWAAFSLVAALGQLGLRDSAWFTMDGTLATSEAGAVAAGLLLLVAGAHQFTAVKDRCLDHCRHPLTFLMMHWREGLRGAFPLGARHGVYCFGCCIAFMGLMFVFGTMNVLWMAAIALYFLAEKVLPHERVWGRAAGAGLLAAGAAVLAQEVI